MLVFPNCKINLGLNVTEKRPDGFHNITTVFYPVTWCDALELIDYQCTETVQFSFSGIKIEGGENDNLLFKTWKLISKITKLPPLKIHLHKNIPMGAGIGGGSSDAAFFINLLDQKFGLKLPDSQKHDIASQLGSDCSFFLQKKPLYAQGRGNVFSSAKIDLSKHFILLAYPNIHSNTKEAFSGLQPKEPAMNLKKIIEEIPMEEWKNCLFNDFDSTILKKYPAIRELKDKMYTHGAVYASMSGSGSAVYGIFKNKPSIVFPPSYKWYLQLPAS